MLDTFLFFDLQFGLFFSILDTIYTVSILFALFVITIRNPVISVLFLIGLFFAIGVYLISIGLEFIGLAYLLVYVGAVSILFLFILMLLNIRVSELVNETKNSAALIFTVSISFIITTYILMPDKGLLHYVDLHRNYYPNWDANLLELLHISNLGNVIYTSYGVWLILISIVLLLAMIGAIVINIKRKILELYNLSKTLCDNAILFSWNRFSLKKLLNIIVIASILWCLRYILMYIFNLSRENFAENILLVVLTTIIFIFMEDFMISNSPSAKLDHTAVKPDQTMTVWSSSDPVENDSDPGLTDSDNESHTSANPEVIEELKLSLDKAIGQLVAKENNQTEDSEGNDLKDSTEIYMNIADIENELMRRGQEDYVDEIENGNPVIARARDNYYRELDLFVEEYHDMNNNDNNNNDNSDNNNDNNNNGSNNSNDNS